MKIEIERINTQEELLLIVKGQQLNTTTAPQLEAELGDDLTGLSRLVLDFSELGYITSAGLRVVLLAYNKMDDQGGIVVVKGANEEVQGVFNMTGFTDILSLE